MRTQSCHVMSSFRLAAGYWLVARRTYSICATQPTAGRLQSDWLLLGCVRLATSPEAATAAAAR